VTLRLGTEFTWLLAYNLAAERRNEYKYGIILALMLLNYCLLLG